MVQAARSALIGHSLNSRPKAKNGN
jgi:hypothetical protein